MDQVDLLPEKNIIPKVFQSQHQLETIDSLFIDSQKKELKEKVTVKEKLDIIQEFLHGDYDL